MNKPCCDKCSTDIAGERGKRQGVCILDRDCACHKCTACEADRLGCITPLQIHDCAASDPSTMNTPDSWLDCNDCRLMQTGDIIYCLKHRTKPATPDSWEEEFDKTFYPLDNTEAMKDEYKTGFFWGRKETLEECRAFIRETITRERARVVEEILAKVGSMRPVLWSADVHQHNRNVERYNTLDEVEVYLDSITKGTE